MSDLTARQKKIFFLLGESKTNKEIADVIGKSEHTVKAEVREIYLKLGVVSKDETDNHSARRRAMIMAQEWKGNGGEGGGEIVRKFSLEEIIEAANNLFTEREMGVVRELVDCLTLEF